MSNQYNDDDDSNYMDPQQSIFDPGVMQSINNVKTHVSNEGLIAKFACPKCGAYTKFCAEFIELICIADGVAPQFVIPGGDTWSMDPKQMAFYPSNPACRHCGYSVPVLITPHEAASAVNRGLQSGFVPKPQYDQLRMRIAQIRQQAGR